MKVLPRALVSLFAGTVLYVGILFAVFRFAAPLAITQVLTWNIRLFSFLGRGEPGGYMPDGAPIYDGNEGFLGMSAESIMTGFVIYPVLIFFVLTIASSIRARKLR